MSLFTRYIIRYFGRFFIGGLMACVALFFLLELFDRLDEFIERQVLWSDALRYLAFKLPGIVYNMAPAACLLASVLTFSTLSKHQEITAMRAIGLAPGRLALPLCCLGGVIGLGMLVAQEYVVPYTNHMANLVWRTRIQRSKRDLQQGLFKSGQIWYRSRQRIWSVRQSYPLEQRFLGVTIYDLDPSGVIRQRYDAAEALWDAQGWRLRHGMHYRFDAGGNIVDTPETFVAQRFDFSERPMDISALRKQPEDMSLQELAVQARQLRQQGVQESLYLLVLQGKIAFASVSIIMAGFGVPLALHANRNGGMVQAVGLTLGAGFSYWVLYSMAMALGHSGQLPPFFAAWSANGCFGVCSFYLSRRLS